jgi:hypothetical protein
MSWLASPDRAIASPPLVERLPESAALRVLLTAIASGLIAQLLFVAQRPGINLVLWVGLVLAAALLLRRPGVRLDRYDLWLAPAALTFAAFVALRDDIALRIFDVPAAGALTLAAVAAAGGNPVTRGSWLSLGWLASMALGLTFAGAAWLGAGLAPMAARLGRGSGLLPVLRGLLVAVPLVIVFAGLFASADAVFAAHLDTAFAVQLDMPQLLSRTLFASVAAWLFAGTIVCAWLSRPVEPPVEGDAATRLSLRVGVVEGLIVLLALDLVFAFFVVVQGAYLFGGLDTLAVSGMTYSEYARRGFFELIAVAMLAGTVILAVDRLVAERGWVYRASSLALAGLTGAVLLSAVVRLGLYQAAYGWTELRFYALAAVVWLAVGIFATGAGLLLDRASLVPRVLVGAGLVIALGANVIGPQSYVTGQNLQRAIEPGLVAPGGESGLDLNYLGFLGDDSIPVLTSALPQLPQPVRRQAEELLRSRARFVAAEGSELGWPSWNLARQRAIEALQSIGYLPLSD